MKSRTAMEEALLTFTANGAIELLSAHHVPVSKVHSVNQALKSEHAACRGAAAQEADGFRTFASPFHLTDSIPPSPAPTLGQPNGLIDRWGDGPLRTEL